MIMKKFAILLVAITLGTACGNSTEANAEANTVEQSGEDKVMVLKKEIMEVHDKTMKQMTTMSKLRKELRQASKEAQDTAAYYNAYQDLYQAHEDMMDWMHNFQNPDEMDVTEEEKISYLGEQKEKVVQLEEYTNSSIEKAEAVLSQK